MFGLEPLTPAYGRDYINIVDVQKDFDNDKDFKTAGGPYTNKSDLLKLTKLVQIRVRFSNLEETDFLII